MGVDNDATVKADIKGYLLSEFLPGEDPTALTETTPLMTAGILDSIATLKMVSFLEDRFKVTIEAHEADAEHMNTIADMARLVESKQSGSKV
jgi:acyl carrier protein